MARRDRAAEFAKYQRSGPVAVASRVTHVIGAADVSLMSLEIEQQIYHVATRTGARLVFRDLYWPGFHATLNGRDIPIRPLDNTLVSVALPPGASGTLQVTYQLLSTRDLVALPAASGLLLGAVCLWLFRLGRREEASS